MVSDCRPVHQAAVSARERESRGDRKGGRLQAVIKVAEDGLAELTLNRGSEETGAGPARV